MSFCSLPNVQNKVLPKPFPKTTNDVLNGISLTIIYRIAVVDTLLNARTCLCSSISRIFLKETETSTSTGFPEIIKIPIKDLRKNWIRFQWVVVEGRFIARSKAIQRTLFGSREIPYRIPYLLHLCYLDYRLL